MINDLLPTGSNIGADVDYHWIETVLALQLNIFMGFTFNGQFCVGIKNCDFTNLIDNCLIDTVVLQRSAALFQIFGTNRTKENVTGQGKCVG